MKTLFVITICFCAVICKSQSKWENHLSEFRPYAELKADFPLVQAFPYNHKYKPLLTVPSLGLPLISIFEGQILNKETVRVQFGATGNIEDWKIKLPEDGSSNHFYIVEDRLFKRKLRESNILRITILLYQNGEQTIYFTTKDFKL